jgi:hypothetical protein
MTINEAFEKFTTISKTKNGFSARCKKGLWGVDAPTKEACLKEAKRYFMQYYFDGEYEEKIK